MFIAQDTKEDKAGVYMFLFDPPLGGGGVCWRKKRIEGEKAYFFPNR